MNVEPISAHKSNSKGCLFLIGGLLFLVGSIFVWFLGVTPVLNSRGVSRWLETPCLITSSVVNEYHDAERTTYRPHIEFSYEIKGTRHSSDTYDFTNVNRSRDRCRSIVDAHVVGQQATCFVDPNNPDSAVIVRDYELPWPAIILPMIFSATGLGLILLALFYNPRKTKALSASVEKSNRNTIAKTSLSTRDSLTHDTVSKAIHPGDAEDQKWDQPQKLKPSQTRVGKLLVTLLFAVLWNGIVSTFVFAAVNDGFGFSPVLLLIPFILVGICLILATIYMFAAMLNPLVELALTTGAVRRGDSVDVAWQLDGRTSKIRNLKISIEGEESATYGQGTSVTTDRHVFSTIPVIETTDAEDIKFGNQSVSIPATTMHTFSAVRNSIQWRVVVHGDIPWWPDINEQFEFRVKP